MLDSNLEHFWRGEGKDVGLASDIVREAIDDLPTTTKTGASPALEGELKAWWVPPRYVRGAWVGNEFVPASRLRSATPDPGRDTAAPCHCELATLVEQGIGAWRQTHLPA